jgi:uncharacterized membrane protein YhaH (DUF805 family)
LGFELDKGKRNFWIGNAVLTLAMVMLFFMGQLSEAMGIWAAVLWMALTAVGVGLVLSDKSGEPPTPD